MASPPSPFLIAPMQPLVLQPDNTRSYNDRTESVQLEYLRQHILHSIKIYAPLLVQGVDKRRLLHQYQIFWIRGCLAQPANLENRDYRYKLACQLVRIPILSNCVLEMADAVKRRSSHQATIKSFPTLSAVLTVPEHANSDTNGNTANTHNTKSSEMSNRSAQGMQSRRAEKRPASTQYTPPAQLQHHNDNRAKKLKH